MKITLFLALTLVASTSAIFFKHKPHSVLITSAPVKSEQAPVREIVQQVTPVREVIQQVTPVREIIQQVTPVHATPVQSLSEVQVPVISTHNVQVVPVPVDVPIQRAQVVSVEPSGQSVHLVFKSQSSPLSVQQQHLPGERTLYETTRSEEQPHIIRHEVFKPVIQELRETIQPYRHVTQEIKPVLEKVNVLVPKGQPQSKGFWLPVIKPPRTTTQQFREIRPVTFPTQQQMQQAPLPAYPPLQPELPYRPIVIEQGALIREISQPFHHHVVQDQQFVQTEQVEENTEK